MKNKLIPVLFLLPALVGLQSVADVVTVEADRDNSLFSENGGLSNGAGDFIFSGRTRLRLGTDRRRALVHFDVAAGVPAGSTINSATIQLRVSKVPPGSATRPFVFHRLLSDWGEGASDATGAEGRGTTATAGDATWTHSFFGTTMWTTDGGDFNPTGSASTDVAGLGFYDWSSAQLAADVQDMLDNSATNFGWILIGTESTVLTARRFDSRDNSVVANRPQLTIDFTPPPPPEFTVATVTPDHAALDVASDSTVVVTFSDPVNDTTIDASSYKVWGKQTGFKAGSFASATFDPTLDFKPGEEVHVMLTSDVESGAGTSLTPHLSQFTVASGGSETFLLSSVQAMGNAKSFDIGLGDLDGDGDLDAFVVNNGQGNRVWTNEAGVFTDSGQSLGTASSLTVALGDFDNDDDLDAFVGNDGEADAVWLNNGSGVFVASGQTLAAGRSFGVGLGDADGDGDIDAFIADNGGANTVWTNDGSGNFSNSGQALGAASTRSCDLGDLDGDGDLDAFAAVNGGADTIWLNDGSGVFTLNQSLGMAASFGCALGDLDGDGDLDAFVTTVGMAGDLVLINDGSGTFTDSGQLLGNVVSRAVELGDVDGDGDLDAFVVNNSPATNRVWINDGSGAFGDNGDTFGNSAHRGVALGDVDGDGDLDVLLANQMAPNDVFLNFHTGETDDFDGDGIPTNSEIELGLDPANPADAGEDLDGDGESNLAEFIADTDLNDPDSVLALTDITAAGTTKVFFTPSSPDRLYTLQRSADLTPASWGDVAGQVEIVGVGGPMMLEDPDPVAGAKYYRVVVELP